MEEVLTVGKLKQLLSEWEDAMKANELRIGNFVIADGYYPYADIDAINKEFVNIGSDSFAYDAIEPIPLTEEWLLRFGFFQYHEDKYDSHWNHKTNFKVELSLDKKILALTGTSVKLSHVHQLQNLYFALTNKELEYER